MKSNQSNVGVAKVVTAVLAGWLALVLMLGSRGVFQASPGAPPLGILLGVLAPVAVFLVAFGFSERFRRFALEFDPRLGAGLQAWRFAGLGFLALYAYGVLPGSFALPAGLGDMAIGVTAPWIMLALLRRPEFARSRLFVAWNLLGILDLVVAVSSGGLNAVLARGVPGEITTAPMAQLPLVLIPAYFVPIFLMVHFSALFQARAFFRQIEQDVTSASAVTAHAR
jgi:hypothetical protein